MLRDLVLWLVLLYTFYVIELQAYTVTLEDKFLFNGPFKQVHVKSTLQILLGTFMQMKPRQVRERIIR